MIENKLKIIASKIMLNISDSKETLDKNKSFVKGGTMKVVWNNVVNFVELEECAKNKHRWRNTEILESNVKT